MQNPKTTTLGIVTIVAAVALGAKELLATGTLPDLTMLVGQIAAGIGLLHAADGGVRQG